MSDEKTNDATSKALQEINRTLKDIKDVLIRIEHRLPPASPPKP